ncbi:hypothetical protein ACFVR1_08260 [Psychrobacillus sp. NPDC058041]|uniref:tubby C-terminal domain-like protein n=1 Tax=Psychrobacillus sp. NPDC058041 TaxID=3346310 RepID=UPI0036DDC66A
MHTYTYTQPLSIESTPMTSVYNEGVVYLTFQRFYAGKLTKFADKLMDYRYFLNYHVYNTNNELIFTCKKVSRKGRVYYEAKNLVEPQTYIVAYDKWKELIPDLMITDGNLKIKLHKEMEGWSRFTYDNKEIARWKAELNEEFSVQLEIEEDSPIQNAAFFVAISQCALFVGG